MLYLSITLLTALLCGFLFYKLKVPGGMMVGAIVGVSALSITTGSAFMPPEAKLTAQCLAGAFIACSVEKGDLQNFGKLWKPALFLLGAMLALNLTVGFLIYWCSPLDMVTSLISAVPGGMSDIPVIAADMGADAPKVAVLQFVRMSAGIGVFPSLIAHVTKGVEETTGEVESLASNRSPLSPLELLLTLLVAFFCGILGKWIGIPAGALVCSMLGVIALKLLTGKAFLPVWAKRLAQMLSGAYIGSGIGREDLLALRLVVFPAVLLLVCYFANAVLTGTLMHRLFGLGHREGMLTATPAGATDMALISSDLGIYSNTLVELQVIRMIVVITLFPQIIRLVAAAFG